MKYFEKYKTLALAALGSSLFFACNQQADDTGKSNEKSIGLPNILWVNTEDIGPALGCYGDERAKTPYLDQLAAEGIIFTNAYATSPISAPSRSTLITGIHSTSTGTQHLRSEVPMPESLKILPQLMSNAGYYCITTHKTDYNFSPEGRWDEVNDEQFWKTNTNGQPFFSMVTLGITHEGQTNSYKRVLDSTDFHHDPSDFELPPYVPQSDEMRSLYARQYDLITKMDKQFSEIVEQLKNDGLYENTIIFFFSDHGFGLPKGKRWLLPTGLKVPLIVRIPEKYQHLADAKPGSKVDQLVSFEDFAPTVLNLAGIAIPEYMQGTPFLGEKDYPKKQYLFGSRSRADDVYDISRSVYNGQYFYVRHFMPYLPMIEDALIFSSRKRSVKELRKYAAQGDSVILAYFQAKPVEELYNMANDPHMMNNLAFEPQYADKKAHLQDTLYQWILDSRDIGFLNESEMLARSAGSSPYEYAQSQDYDLENILSTAWKVGKEKVSFEDLKHPDSGVRYWAVENFINQHDKTDLKPEQFSFLLDDECPIVQIKAAELMCYLGDNSRPTEILAKHLQNENQDYLVLQAAISLRRIGEKATPVIPQIKKVREKHAGEVWNRYKNWFASMFIGFALDQTLLNCNAIDQEKLIDDITN